jgi:hypothetical protein
MALDFKIGVEKMILERIDLHNAIYPGKIFFGPTPVLNTCPKRTLKILLSNPK